MSILKKITSPYLCALLLTVNVSFLSAQKPPSQEYQLKAAFLFNFTQFVEWPANIFSSAKAPIVIGILGEDPFGSYLDEIVSGEEINGHPLVVQRYHSTEEIKTCHILFINLPKVIKQEQILSTLKGKSILSVGEATNFIKEGGMIKFSMVDNKIHFQINPEAAKEAGLTISSKLLRLAEITVPKKNNN
jgi:hypothetical protein